MVQMTVKKSSLLSIVVVYSTIISCNLPNFCPYCKATSVDCGNSQIHSYSVSQKGGFSDNAQFKNIYIIPKNARGIYAVLKNKSYEFESDEKRIPPYTSRRLILQALLSKPDHKMTLREIFKFVVDKYAYYRRSNINTKDWKTALSDVISRNKKIQLFIRIPPKVKIQPNKKNRPGRQGGQWTFKPQYEEIVYEEAYKIGRRLPIQDLV